MQNVISRYLLKLRKMGSRAKVILSLLFVLLMANLHALVDLVFHPEIRYFDVEHILDGALTTFLAVLFMIGIYKYTVAVEARLRDREASESALRAAIARAEQEKNKSEAIIAAMGDGISIQDLNYKILYQNQVHKNFIGSHEGDYCYRAYEQQEQVCDQCPVALSFKDGGVHTIERVVRFGDETRYFEITTSPLRDADGKIIAGIEAVRDITKRRRAEERLADSERILRQIIDSAPYGAHLYELKEDGRLVFMGMNKAADRILGMDNSQFIGKTIEEAFPPLKDTELPGAYRATAAQGTPFEQETVEYKNEKIRGAFEVVTAQIGKNRMAAFFRDITERRRSEDALRESEERYKRLSQEFDALLNAIPDTLVLLSPELKVLWANRGAARGLGKDVPDLTGHFCYGLWHDRNEPCDPCPVRRSFTTGVEENGTVTSPDGRIWDLRTFPLKDDAGTVISVIEVARDITQHRRLERQLIQAQKMEAVGLLAGGIAHDFNNILTAVIGYGSLVLGKMKADDPLRTYVEQVLAASRRAVDLTRGLLAFSRRQVINPLPVEINDIIRRTEQILHRIIGEDIELRTVLSERPTTAVVDPGQIEQVFMNLATNARDAMPNGGRLVIETGIARLDEEYLRTHEYAKKGTYVVISVTDTGMGMDEQTREHVFEPFFTTKEVGKGTGLGLSIVYGIVKQHNGYVNCYSEPGRGTTFKIYLPVAGEKAELPIVKTEEAVPRGSEIVLLAEDDEIVRNLEKTVLEEFGYSVIEAKDGQEAIDKLRENKNRVQLIIIDVIMPKMNGKEVYAQALRMRPDIKTLFTSGYTADLVHKQGIIEKGLDFISKPASPQEFLKAVRKALERQ